jgi:response regulator RpfG family c-di-GMP phosphodiesterase
MKMVFETGMCSLQSSIIRNKEMAGGEENNNGGKNSFSVLVVDDDTIIRMVHRMLVTGLGLKVQEAKNGKEAVDLHINGASFDLILMDMEMPIMNGPAVCSCEIELNLLYELKIVYKL